MKVIARVILGMDATLCYLGYMYGLDHGHNVLGYYLLGNAIVGGLLAKRIVDMMFKESL